MSGKAIARGLLAAAIVGMALIGPAQAGLVIDIRVSNTGTTLAKVDVLDSKTAVVKADGATIGLDLYAITTGANGDTTDDGLVAWMGSVRQSVPGYGTVPGTYQVAGDLSPGAPSAGGPSPLSGIMWDFQGPARPNGEITIWARGTSQDLGNLLGMSATYKDGFLDVGGMSGGGTSANSYICAASYLVTFLPNPLGSTEVMFAHVVYTVRPGTGYSPSGTDTTQMNVVTRGSTPALATAMWFEDGSFKNNKPGQATAGRGSNVFLSAVSFAMPSMTAHLGEDPTVFTSPTLDAQVAGNGGAYSTVQSVVAGPGAGSGGAPILLLDHGAKVLAGVNNDGDPKTVSMTWRVRTTNEAKVKNDPLFAGGLASNVLSLSGMGKTGAAPRADGSVPTDPFVLQMEYDPMEYQRIWGIADTQAAAGHAIYLGYLDPGPDCALGTADDTWRPAVCGNFTGTPQWVDGGWDGTLSLGHYGIDTSVHVVWAVLDHNSQFAAVPEPGTLVLAGVGALVGLFTWRRKRGAAALATEQAIPTPAMDRSAARTDCPTVSGENAGRMTR